MFHDSLFENETFIDLACLMCGRRRHVPKSNPLARLVLKRIGR